MDKNDIFQFDSENTSLINHSQEVIDEMKRLSNFLKIYITTNLETLSSFEKKLQPQKNEPSFEHESILLTSIVKIYETFRSYLKNINKIINKIQYEIVAPLDEFRKTQLSIYKENFVKLKEIPKIQKDYNEILENSKNFYYKQAFKTKNQIEIENSNENEHIFDGNKNVEKTDLFIENKMKTKLWEILYQYEIVNYNKNIINLNKEYDDVIDKTKLAEKSRIYFIKSSIEKFKKCIHEYIDNIKNATNNLDNFFSNEIYEKDEKFYLNEISKYKKNDYRIPLEKFISFNDYINNNKDKTITEESFDYNISQNNDKILKFDEKEEKTYINNLIDDLLKSEDMSEDKIAIMIQLLKINKDSDKLFLDLLLEKKKAVPLKFKNLKNLEYLSHIISYISLQNDSIFTSKFELNFNIILISESVFYQNKTNLNKVYLTAILSKNKYFRTIQFWRNVIELKLSNKLCDHIERLRKLILPEEKKKGIFSKLSDAIGLNNDIRKISLLAKSRILPLIKYYKEIEPTKIPIIDRMATEEMASIIRNSIPNCSNFNFPKEQCYDLITKLADEYKISKENIKFFVIYANVSSCTIRKKLPNKNNDFVNNDLISCKNMDPEIKKIKFIAYSIPYLSKNDFHNLFLCSKLVNKKLSKKVYSYILKQKNITNKTRLDIWGILLSIPKLKQNYNYKEILNKANDEKTKNEIALDVLRTSVPKNQNEEKIKEKLTNILYAVSQINDGIKYCQGMNFLVEFLLCVFNEDDVFYIFLSFFKNTEYSLIFAKNLDKLKIFFYVFRRIISLYEPELYSYFNSFGIDVNFFLPPWFITLFTGSHQHSNENNEIILLRILDNFITHGWKAMMEIGCIILHKYEESLMNMRYDGMMQFLINDMLKSEFFAGKNQENIEKSMMEMKISKKLIKNIEAEYHQDKKLKEGNE